MAAKKELPKEYQPFKRMVVCSNTLTDFKVPISVDDHPVFLIGASEISEIPKIWLQAKSKAKGSWAYLIEEGVSKNTGINLQFESNVLSVYFNDLLILHAVRDSEESITITHIDLRPIGFSITGNLQVLKVGNQHIARNTFSNVNTMINVQ